MKKTILIILLIFVLFNVINLFDLDGKNDVLISEKTIAINSNINNKIEIEDFIGILKEHRLFNYENMELEYFFKNKYITFEELVNFSIEYIYKNGNTFTIEDLYIYGEKINSNNEKVSKLYAMGFFNYFFNYFEYKDSFVSKEFANEIVLKLSDKSYRNIPIIITNEFENTLNIRNLDYTKGTFVSGDKLNVSFELENNSCLSELWLDIKLKNKNNEWIIIPSEKIELNLDKIQYINYSFSVPNNLISGEYKLFLSTWDKELKSIDAKRISYFEGTDNILLYNEVVSGIDFSSENWIKINSFLGKSKLVSKNVLIKKDILKIKKQKNSFSGGEIRNAQLKSFGSYEIEMKIPNEPSSITGFFLYKEPDYENEIDIEIYNDNSGIIMFTTYFDGEKKNEYIYESNLNLTHDFYKYRFDYYQNQLSFYFNDTLIISWNDGYSLEPMYLMLNVWSPDWIEYSKPSENVFLEVKYIKY